MSGRDVKETKKSGLSVLDTALVAAAVVGGIFVVLWIAHAVIGLVLFAFKVAILVVIVAVIVRIVHATRRHRG
jgi:hypothetical protein